jgi:hypothetical protein
MINLPQIPHRLEFIEELMTAKDKNDEKPSMTIYYAGEGEYLTPRKDKKKVATENEKKN